MCEHKFLTIEGNNYFNNNLVSNDYKGKALI